MSEQVHVKKHSFFSGLVGKNVHTHIFARQVQVKITYDLETSDHDSDGYDSCGECDYNYTQEEIITNIELEQLVFDDDGSIINMDDFLHLIPYPSEQLCWERRIPKPDLYYCCNHYCWLTQQSQENGLDKHDYRITIVSMEIIE